jgi:hypothetical protein
MNLMKTILRSIGILLPAVILAAGVAAREDHRPYRDAKAPDCAECHKESGVAPNHGGGWDKEHRIVAAGPNSNCYDCHDQGTCQDCHKGGGIEAKLSSSQWKRDIKPESHRSDWISMHPIQAQSNPQQCSRCHEPQFCSNCHGGLQRNALTLRSHAMSGATQVYIAAFPSEHADEARRNLASCQSCHPEGDVCLTCHSARSGLRINPHPRDFNAGRIQSRSNNRSCRVCHDF